MSETRHNLPRHPRPRSAPPHDEHDLYVEYDAALRRVLAARVKTTDANLDDACSYAWTQLVAKQPRRKAIFAWLITVATREAWRLHRLMHRDVGGGADVALDELESPTADESAEQRLRLRDVGEALQSIHPRRRKAMLLHAAGFTYEEIAMEYGVSVERAWALVYRARVQLRARMDAD